MGPPRPKLNPNRVNLFADELAAALNTRLRYLLFILRYRSVFELGERRAKLISSIWLLVYLCCFKLVFLFFFVVFFFHFLFAPKPVSLL